MRTTRTLRIRSGKSTWTMAMAVGAVGLGVGMVSHADGAAIDVQLANSQSSATTYPIVGAAGLASNSPLTIPDAPGQTYDAADTTDSGTIWNSLITPPNVKINNTTGSTLTTVVSQNVPLVDSAGN